MQQLSSRRNSLLALMCLCAILSGCQQEGPTIVKTAGTLLIKGQPVPDVMIHFSPTKGRDSFAHSDKDGKFEVIYSRSINGLLISDYQVWLEHTYTQYEKEGFLPEGVVKPSAEILAICQKYGSPATGMKVSITAANSDLKLNFE